MASASLVEEGEVSGLGMGYFPFVVVVILGVALCALMLPTVTQNMSSSDLNISGPAASVVDLMPTFLALLAVAVAVVGILLVVNR